MVSMWVGAQYSSIAAGSHGEVGLNFICRDVGSGDRTA
jgi:hypothetical protein